MECKKDIRNLIEGIDEFKEKYVTYRTKTLRTILVKTLSYIKRKEQECEELKKEKEETAMRWKESIRGGAELCGKLQNYMQALDEIEQTISNFPSKGIQEIPQTQAGFTQYFLSINEAELQKILNVVNETKGL